MRNAAFSRTCSGFAGLPFALLLAGLLAAPSAIAQTTHSLSGNLRFQVGILPTPITLQPVPDGAVLAVPGATIMMTSPNGALSLAPGQLAHPATPVSQPLFFAANAASFRSSIAVQFPKPGSIAVFAPSGRSGADTVTFCPGQTVTPSGNPACTGPGQGTINGLMRYTRTAGAIGGRGQASLQGGASVWIRDFGASGAPCAAGVGGSLDPSCRVAQVPSTPPATAAQGGPFGFVLSLSRPGLSPGRFYATRGPLGTVVNIDTANPLGPGLANPVTSYAGPWTAGRLTVSVTQNAGGSVEKFILSGSDNRNPATGQGSVSLVAGSVSDRSLSAPNANRGWLNLQIATPFGLVPAMTPPGVAAAIGLVALVGLYFVRRRSL